MFRIAIVKLWKKLQKQFLALFYRLFKFYKSIWDDYTIRDDEKGNIKKL